MSGCGGAGQLTEELAVLRLGELPGATAADEIGDASLRAKTPQVGGVAFLLRERGAVVSVTCGVNQCPDSAMVLRLAKLVESHLSEWSTSPKPAEGKK